MAPRPRRAHHGPEGRHRPARNYSLGGEIVVYPTAIGSEPSFPKFHTQPLWQQVIVANGINSGLFMVVPNRIGHEGKVTFYGSSFISDPYGRVLVQAPRDQEAVPESYDALTVPVDVERPFGVGHPATAVVK